MTMESARTVVNKLLKYHEIGKVSFFGGEPLTNFAIIQYLTKSIANQVKVDEFEITTDLILLTSEMVSFFERYNFSIIVSLDGPERIHNYLRPACNYDIIMNNICILKKSKICDKICINCTYTNYHRSNMKLSDLINSIQKLVWYYHYERDSFQKIIDNFYIGREA